jgi:hypothetical protein
MPQSSSTPREPSSKVVIVRVVLRLLLLATFATFATQGFAKSLTALLLLSAVYCAVVAALRQEEILAAS